MLAGCSAEIDDGRSSGRVGRAIQPIIAGLPSGAEHDGVVVLAQFEAGVRRGLCSATLVAPNLVLTARHCVSNSDSSIACNTDGTAAFGGKIHDDVPAANLVVFVGKNGAPPSLADEAGAKARGTKLVVDDSKTLCNHDLAFVLLDRPVDAPIATLRLSGGPTATERVTVVGWGVDQTGTLPATRRAREDVAITGIGPTLMTDKRFGIGNAEVMFGEAACAGDSGGPAFTRSGALVGVASRVGNGKPADPTNYAATCTGETAHSIYTHLGQSADLVRRAFAEAGNHPVVEPAALALDAPRKTDPEETTVGADLQAPSLEGDEAAETKMLRAVPAGEAEANGEGAGCSIGGTGRSDSAPWLVMIGIVYGIRIRSRSRSR